MYSNVITPQQESSLTTNLNKVSKPKSMELPKISTSVGNNKLNLSKGAQSALGAVGSALGQASAGGLSEDQTQIREGIRSVVSNLGPIGAIIGAATGVVDAVGSMTGLNLDNIDKSSAKRAGAGAAATSSQIVNSIPGLSMFVGMFAGKTDTGYKSQETESTRGAFENSLANIDAGQNMSNKRVLFGRKKINKFINEQNMTNAKLTNIALEKKDSDNNIAGNMLFEAAQERYSGHTPKLLLSKAGIKFPELDEAMKKINSWKKESSSLKKFQIGGKMNLIPEGALHARKHSLSDKDPELDGNITTKGIPVIIKTEDGIQQTAEIEKNEWTLRKEFTEELEALYKAYKKNPIDEIAIKAGKLICFELLKNTDDRSGLIKSIK